MQFFSLIYLAAYSKLYEISTFFQELSLVLASIFSLSFAFSFFNEKTSFKIESLKELFIYSFILIVALAISFYHYILFEYLPYTIIYFLLFILFAFDKKRGVVPTSIYLFGWSLVCIFLYFFKFKTIYIQGGYIDLVLIAFLVEAILFSISIGYRYQIIHKESKKVQDLLLHQSRLAESGQMISSIAHQWRQPLNSISYILINIKKRFNKGSLDREYLDKKINQASLQLEFMSKTIDDFREFYTPSKNRGDFYLLEAISRAVTIINDELKRANIELEIINNSKNPKVYGITSELSQVILSLLSNAKDALNGIENPKIIIELDSNSAEIIVKVKDNAKGISKKESSKVFELYYSSKKEGSGIGLYLVKSILEDSFDGKIALESSKKGACFIITLPKSV